MHLRLKVKEKMHIQTKTCINVALAPKKPGMVELNPNIMRKNLRGFWNSFILELLYLPE
jgi:hypothetical protein